MDNQTTWANAVAAASRLYADLAVGTRAELDALIDRIMRLKKELLERTISADSASICRSCGGQCCLNGKYHFSLLDLLAYRKAAVEPVVPNFAASPACPYAGEAGCLMAPGFRPMTCVVFNCGLIEDRMTPAELTELYACERMLRRAIADAGQVVGQRLDRALLLSIGS